MKVLVTGVSGTGKSTVCYELLELGVDTIGLDEEGLCFWKHKTSGERVQMKADFTDNFLENHDWDCDLERLEKLLEEVDGSVVVCGNCDNVLELMEMVDVTLQLQCEPEIFLNRIAERGDNEYGKNEAGQKALLGYYQKFNDMCVADGAIVIDANQSIEKVVTDVMGYIK